jgi:hypothetical protein
MSAESKSRLYIEARILAHALKESLDGYDATGALSAHEQLSAILDKIANQPDQPDRQDIAEIAINAETEQLTLLDFDQFLDKSIELKEIQTDAVSEPEVLDPLSILEVEKEEENSVIHLKFLTKVRKLLKQQKSNQASHAFRQELRKLSIAHDILVAQSNKRQEDSDKPAPQDKGSEHKGDKSAKEGKGMESGEVQQEVRLGELLQLSEILEATELSIAVDMHKAMPELKFGEFMVKQGFITEDELEAVLAGQRLLISKKLTSEQFKEAMQNLRNNNVPFIDTLTKNKWVEDKDLEP